MRPLTEEETKTLFQKLAEYMGRSVERLINRSDERHCFRLIKVCKVHNMICDVCMYVCIILCLMTYYDMHRFFSKQQL